jgi:hypothetical protein
VHFVFDDGDKGYFHGDYLMLILTICNAKSAEVRRVDLVSGCILE